MFCNLYSVTHKLMTTKCIFERKKLTLYYLIYILKVKILNVTCISILFKKTVDELVSLFILRFYSILFRLLIYKVMHTNRCDRIMFANGSLLATLKWLCKVVITAMQ